MTQVKTQIGKIMRLCDCGDCPPWFADSIGMFALQVWINEQLFVFGPFEGPNEAEACKASVLERLEIAEKANKEFRENSSDLH